MKNEYIPPLLGRSKSFLRGCLSARAGDTEWRRNHLMRRDDGLDVVRGETAAKEVAFWRKAGKLPFPRLAPDRIEKLKDTLDYPPLGSVEAGDSESQVWETSEVLSAEPVDEDESDREPPSQSREDDS